MPDTAFLAKLKEATGAAEAYQVWTFRLYRRTQEGRPQNVNVTVLDAGPEAPNRYSIHAEAEDGRSASGNPDESLDAALAAVHWTDLG